MIDLPTILQSIIDFFPHLSLWVVEVVNLLIIFSLVLSVCFVLGIIFCVEALKRIRDKEASIHDLKVEDSYETVDKADSSLSKRWDSVMRHIDSPNQNDWKQAIIEADVMLDDLLNKMEYRGASVGEKLKRVEKGDFKTLDDAWEAHKVRNQIAHEGVSVTLSHYEAKRVINMYKKVFEEFFYI